MNRAIADQAGHIRLMARYPGKKLAAGFDLWLLIVRHGAMLPDDTGALVWRPVWWVNASAADHDMSAGVSLVACGHLEQQDGRGVDRIRQALIPRAPARGVRCDLQQRVQPTGDGRRGDGGDTEHDHDPQHQNWRPESSSLPHALGRHHVGQRHMQGDVGVDH